MFMELFPLVLISVANYCSAFEYDAPVASLDEWFLKVNEQYEELNQYSAAFSWDLIVNPTTELYDEASLFGGVRSRWRNRKCAEAESFEGDMSAVEKRMYDMLCRGPKYSDSEGSELSAILTEIQDIYTSTQICLPKAFDICLNYNRIWDYTYAMAPNGETTRLDMSRVKPLNREDRNPLNYYDATENLTDDYYVLRGVKYDAPELAEYEIDLKIRNSPLFCLDIELDLEKIMAGNFSALRRLDCGLPADVIFHWAWEAWRQAVGPAIGRLYPSAVYFMNLGARNNGYKDIGECWREELETQNLRREVRRLWDGVKPYYKLLHGVLRNALWKKYDGGDVLTRRGSLPAHLLGNMWSQEWSGYLKLLAPFLEVDLDERFRRLNWTTRDMVSRSDDFYTSLGINPMTAKFWKHSKFNKASNKTKCHGSAGNMFRGDDFRMIACVDRTIDDFYVIVHEMGHIQYYMHMGMQPPLFQDATNSAFGEAIGDTVFLGMMVPQNLNRLGLLDDKYLVPRNTSEIVDVRLMRVVHETKPLKIPTLKSGKVTVLGSSLPDFEEANFKIRKLMKTKDFSGRSMNAFDLAFLLRMALNKIPQIPFAFILDEWRWDLFAGNVDFKNANDYFWELSLREQGIHPPGGRDRHGLFDAAAKFHVADNTPYVRYFLASILQTQIFKGLCEKTVFASVNTGKKLPMPLHRCDIYGSKRAGRLLKKAMSLGASAHWSEVLYILTGTREISIDPFIEYYSPLFDWLQKLVVEFDIPIGWDKQ